jgi:hypothetical protein
MNEILSSAQSLKDQFSCCVNFGKSLPLSVLHVLILIRGNSPQLRAVLKITREYSCQAPNRMQQERQPLPHLCLYLPHPSP